MQRKGTCHDTQATIELNAVTIQADAPRLHLDVLHHIMQFILETLYLLVGFLNLDVIKLCRQIHLTLLRDTAGRHRQEQDLSVFIADGMHVDFKIVKDMALRHHALRTNPKFLDIVFVTTLAERWHVEQIGRREEFICLIIVEMAYLAHNPVGIKQPAVWRIEGQADNGVLEYLLVLERQFLLLLFLLDQHGFVP